MDMSDIFKPLIVQAGLMILIAFWLVWARVGSVIRGKVDMKDVAKNGWPHWIEMAGNNFKNQYELPLLFFVVCIVLFLTNSVTPLILGLAWFFVFTRIVHTLIHLTFNHIFTRFLVFFSGALSLTALVILTAKGIF